MAENSFQVRVARPEDVVHARAIAEEITRSAAARGTGIAKRTPDYVGKKMIDGQAIISLADSRQVAGFCYIESWGHGRFVANSGLIVFPAFRKNGLAMRIKAEAFALSRVLFPQAKLFGLTTSQAVMNINSDLGYRPVTFGELTDDEAFWHGCSGCVNFQILQSKDRKNCLCTAMLYDPKLRKEKKLEDRKCDQSTENRLSI